MTNDPVEEWLNEFEKYPAPHKVEKLLALVRVYRKACLIHADNDCPCNNCVAVLCAGQKALEIVK